MNNTLNPNISLAQAAGKQAYPFSHQTGKNAARIWLSSKPALTLCAYRDDCWLKFYSTHLDVSPNDQQSFNNGFSMALAEHIAGVNHG